MIKYYLRLNQLESVKSKLNQEMEAINRVDKNLNIHLLGAYQLATTFISKICEYYLRLLNIFFNKDTRFEIS